MMMMSGRNLRRMHTSILALATMVVALSSGVANASYVAFDPISGFDNSSLGLSADYQIPTAGDWLGAGVDGTNGIFIEEVQCLKQMMIDDCAATLPAGTDGYFSQVTWTLSNTGAMLAACKLRSQRSPWVLRCCCCPSRQRPKSRSPSSSRSISSATSFA